MPQSIRPGSAQRAAVFAPFSGMGRSEQVEERLTNAIVLGLLADGEKLPSESTMAREFGVATVTAREALEALRVKGLVRTTRGRGGGSFVTIDNRDALARRRIRGLSRVEIRDMGAYYSAISSMCAQLAADCATESDIEHLAHLVEAVDLDDEIATRRAEGSFRLEIAALSQSARLVREELRIQAEFAPLLWQCFREATIRSESKQSHLRIVDAIAAGDSDSARRESLHHIDSAIRWLVEEKTRLESNGVGLD